MLHRQHLFDRYISTHISRNAPIVKSDIEAHQAALRHFFERHLPVQRDAPILDVGCGYGAFLHFLAQAGYTNTYGVDISGEQVSAAKLLGITNLICDDAIIFLQRHKDSFACITAIDIVEHFTKQEIVTFLIAANRALTPNGMIVVRTINADSPFAARMRYGDFTHELSLNQPSVRQLFALSGFNTEKILPTEPMVHGLKSLARLLIWKTMTNCYKLYLASETGTMGGRILTHNLIAIGRKTNQNIEAPLPACSTAMTNLPVVPANVVPHTL